MRIIVTGATGNVGMSVIKTLHHHDAVSEIVGVARRRPSITLDKVRWVPVDITCGDLTQEFAGADAVIHLAWLIQPSRDQRRTWTVNVEGSSRVFEAAAAVGARALIYASSVGAYSPAPKDRMVDESWPTNGLPTSTYSREKAYVERLLDAFEMAHPEIRVVRFRPGFIFQQIAGSEIRRLFLGPFLPSPLMQPSLIPIVPRLPELRFQAVHSADVGDAFCRAVFNDKARGAYNLATEPVLSSEEIGRALRARPVSVPAGALRLLAKLAWRLRLSPAEPGLVELLFSVPIMDVSRAQDELGWRPQRNADEALLDLLVGIRKGAGAPTPPLQPDRDRGLEGRLGELRTGVGARDGATEEPEKKGSL